jgi:hypothetical protein
MAKRSAPHTGVFTKLRPSQAEPGEVGVFAILPIPAGTNPFPDDTALVYVSEKRLRSLNLSPEIYALYERFGALVGDRRYAPPNFAMAGMSWYVADSCVHEPNLRYNLDDDQVYAIRDIAVGEELTVDYNTIG